MNLVAAIGMSSKIQYLRISARNMYFDEKFPRILKENCLFA